ncbi:hypothetical protein VTI74DRAFT_4159 [Chaetomium olivicolor]
MISICKLAIDDYIVIICTVGVTRHVVVISYSSIKLTSFTPAAQHIIRGTRRCGNLAIYYTVVSFVPGILSFTIPKFAVVILLARILDPNKWHKMLMWMISILYLSLSTGMLIINFAQCTPAAAQWGGAPGTCWDRKITVDYALTLGICSALFDFYLAIYPTVVLCMLQLNWRKKLALSGALVFGYCAGAITCYKCYTLSGLLYIEDFTYAVDDVVLWTNIEGNCVLIGTCIPTLFPLAKKVFGATVLGGGTPKNSHQKQSGPNRAIITIGSYPKNKKRAKGTMGLWQLDTVNESKCIILGEHPGHANTTELLAEAAAPQQHNNNNNNNNNSEHRSPNLSGEEWDMAREERMGKRQTEGQKKDGRGAGTAGFGLHGNGSLPFTPRVEMDQ